MPCSDIKERESAPISFLISSSSWVLEISSFLLGVSMPRWQGNFTGGELTRK